MTKTEAMQAMRRGEKVTHKKFGVGEWMVLEGNRFVFNDKAEMYRHRFWVLRDGPEWETGWSVFKGGK